MPILSVTSYSEEQTLALARKLAASFKPGDVIVLSGPLGAGKTAFVKGLVSGRGMSDSEVSSPTYAFVNEYHGEVPLFHFDLYRIGDPSELFEIGWEDYLARPGIVVVEWGEKAQALLPERYFKIDFQIVDDTTRQIDLALVEP